MATDPRARIPVTTAVPALPETWSPEPEPEAAQPTQAQATQAQAVRSSASMALGTLASRVLGFVKGIVLGIAVAGTATGNIFESANYLPNLIFMLVAGGVFNAVLIPQIVKASRHPDRGSDFISRLLTLGVCGLLVLTALVVAFVGPIMGLYTAYQGPKLELMITFGLFLLPQIFFYGLYSLLGQVLNAHHSYKAYAWAPVLNNVVAIAGLLAFIAVAGSAKSAGHEVADWTPTQTWLLAGTATLGIVVQSVVLLLPVHRLGLNLRPKFDWRGTGLGAMAKIAGWTMATMVVGNLSFLFIVRIATIPTAGDDGGEVAGVLALNRAVELYIMPHSIIALSIATVMFTAMAAAAAAHDFDRLRSALSAALRTTGVATVFAAVALVVLSGPFGMLFGGNQAVAGRQIAIIVAILAIGAPFYSINFILNRVFYAQENAKTPFVIQCIMVVVGISTALLASLLPAEYIVYGIAVSYTISNLLGPLVTHLFLRAQLGDYGAGRILRSHMRFLAAALVAGVAGELVLSLFGGSAADGFLWQSIPASVLTLAVVGLVMAGVYVVMLKVMRVREFDDVAAPLLSRLPGRLGGRR